MRRNNVTALKKEVKAGDKRSAWSRGVIKYAIELLDGIQESIDYGSFTQEDVLAPRMLEKRLLNGADDWKQYSWGGCSLIYDQDIAKRLCTKSELKKTKNGQNRPNKNEEWLDTQARALFQAALRIKHAAEKLRSEERK